MVDGERPVQPRVITDELFHRMIDSVRDYAIFLLDTGGYVATWNRGAERIKQYRADEIIGKHFSTFYPATDVRSGKPDYELRGATEDGRFEDEGWRIRKDGTRFWANVVITALRDDSGELLGFTKVTRDLTERKRAEDEREMLLTAEREARERAEASHVHVQAIHAMTEASLAHLGMSSVLEALLERATELLEVDTAVLLLMEEGGTLAPVAARGLEEVLAEDLHIPIGEGFAGRIAAQREPVVVEDVRYLNLFSSVIPDKGVISMLGVPLLLDGVVIGVLHVGTFHQRRFLPDDIALAQIAAERLALAIDRTRALEAERNARAETLAAQEAARLREEFLAVAAHELKTPLTGLRMSAQLALRRGAGANEQLVPLLEQVVGESDRLDHLIQQLLDASRAEEAFLHPARAETDVSALVHDRITMMRRLRDHPVEARIAEGVIAEVDALRIEQVVANLLDNAAKYSPPDSAIAVELRAGADNVVLSVRDHGPGIPAESRERIFERFYQANAGSHETGLGLGLFITKQIVTAHDGSIALEFPDDGGTRFVVTVPRRATPACDRDDGA